MFIVLKELFTNPSRFYGETFLAPDAGRAARFVLFNGLLIAVGLGVHEAAASRSLSWAIAAFAGLLVLVLPFLLLLSVALWTLILRLGTSLLGEPVPLPETRIAVAYSTAGLLPLVFTGFVPWLALAALVFQVVGLERGLSCSRVRASVLVLFPSGLASLLFLFLMFLFEVF